MVNNRLKIILTTDEIKRIKVTESDDIKIIIDVHGMKCIQAKRLINNIINLVRAAVKLTIIHGYNHGTAIKDMLANNFKNKHVTDQYADPFNYGITYMQISA